MRQNNKQRIISRTLSIFIVLLFVVTTIGNFDLKAATAIEQSITATHTYNSTPNFSISATLPSTVTTNNLIVTAIAIDKNSGAITVPTGFTLVNDYTSGNTSGAMAYKVATGGEQTITWDYTNDQEASVWVAEISGLVTSSVVDVSVENDSGSSSVASISTGTTAATSQDNELAIAMVAVDSGNKVTTGRAWSNGFTSVAHVTDTSGSPALDIATKTLTTAGTQETTFSSTDSTDQMYATLVTFKEPAASSGSLTSTDVEPDSLIVGQTGDVDISFTSENTVPSDGKIKITFPTDLGSGFSFDSGGSTGVSGVAGFDGTLSVGVASNVVTLTRSGGTTSATGAKSLTLSNIQNPSAAGSTGTYRIETTDAGDVVIDLDSSVSADTLTASITSPSLSLSDIVTADVGTHTVTFTTTSTLPADGKIVLTYPDNLGSFTFNSGAATAVQNIMGIDGTLSFSESSDVVTLTRSGGSSFSPDVISFELTNIENPSSSGSTDDFSFKTTDSGDVTIDENNEVSSVTINPGLQGDGTTIGLVSDGDDNTASNASAAMTQDLDELFSQLPSGWGLDTINWQGDIAYGGNNIQAAITAWQNSLAAAAPMFFVVGNHDAETSADMTALETYFDSYPNYNLQGATDISYADKTNYSYEIGDVHVSVVNQYVDDGSMSNRAGSGFIEDSVFDWLKDDIRSSNKTHIIVAGHEPAYPQGRHIGDSLDASPANRDKFVNLLASYGVVGHAVGHTHSPKLYEMLFDEDTSSDATLLGGIWEIDTGAFGTKASSYGSVGYFHANSADWGDYDLRLVDGTGSPEWATPTTTSRSHSDLDRQILVNTWTGSGTGSTENGLFDMQYFIDYTPTVEANPDWSSNNSGRWWESAFDADAAGWTDGELAVGYDDNSASWGWLNTEIDPDPTGEGDEQVHSIFGRVTFQADDPSSYGNLDLEIDYEDSLHVWINGVLVQSLTSSITAPTTGSGSEYFDQTSSDGTHSNPDGKEMAAPVFTTYDIKSHLGDLVDGTNVLTYMQTNYGGTPSAAPGSSDLATAIRLNMYGENSSDLDQKHYRWRNDNDSEIDATFVAAEDTALVGVDLGTQKRIRTLVSNEGSVTSTLDTFTLQWSTSTGGGWSDIVHLDSCGADPICLVNSYNITDDEVTTNISGGLTDEASIFVPGHILDTSTASTAVQLGVDEFTEMEHQIMVTGSASNGETYYLRLQHGSSDLDTYTVYPRLTITASGAASVTETFQEGTGGYSGTIDTVIKDDVQTANSGNDVLLEIDSVPDWGALIEWDLSSLDTSVVVSDASMTFEVTNETSVEYFIYQMFRDWTEDGATWLTTDGSTSWGTSGASNTTNDRSSTSVGSVNLGGGNIGTHLITLNATGVQMVQDWIDGTDSNHGVTIQNYSGSGNGVDLVSSEGATVNQRPILSVTYTPSDSTPPIVTDLTSSVTDDTYTKDDIIDIDITFSEPVTSTGNITLTLNSGGTCVFTVTDSAFATCDYTVGLSDAVADLTVSSISGTINDASSNTLVVFTPTRNLGDNKDIVIIDGTPSPDFDQTHYRWRNDDGAEASATFIAAEDTVLSDIDLGTNMRLRLQVSNEGDLSGSDTLTLQYGTGADPTAGTWTTIPTYLSCISSPICLESSQLVHRDLTTNIASGLTDENTTFVPGEQLVSSATSSSISLGDDDFTEIEYSLKITGNADLDEDYYFRLVKSGLVQLDSYTEVPQISTKTRGTGGFTAYIDNGDNAIPAYQSSGSVLNYGGEDAASATVIDYSDGTDTGLTIALSGSLNEGLGTENIHSDPAYPVASTDADTEFGSIINLSAITFTNTGNDITATVTGLDTDKTYTIVALGMRGEYSDRWSRYTLSGATSFTNDSSSGATKSTVSQTDDSTTYNAGDNYTDGYVAKWTDIDPAGTTLTLMVSGVTVGGDAADKAYLSALKIVDESVSDVVDPSVSDVTSTVIDGSYTVGEVIDVDISFSEPVTSTGNVTVTFDTGGTCIFTINASAAGTCNYTVLDGHTSADLSVISVSGVINDAVGNTLSNTTPQRNLNDNRDIILTTPSVTPDPEEEVVKSQSRRSQSVSFTNYDFGDGQVQIVKDPRDIPRLVQVLQQLEVLLEKKKELSQTDDGGAEEVIGSESSVEDEEVGNDNQDDPEQESGKKKTVVSSDGLDIFEIKIEPGLPSLEGVEKGLNTLEQDQEALDDLKQAVNGIFAVGILIFLGRLIIGF